MRGGIEKQNEEISGTKIITVGIGGADLALSDTVSNSVA